MRNRLKARVKASGMVDAWHFFEGKRDGVSAHVFVNTGIEAKAPLAQLPWCLRFCIRLNDPRDDGLASARESVALAEFEDAILNQSLASKDLEYVGRLTLSGEREWLIYASEEAPRSLLYDADERAGDYEVEFEAAYDPEWKSYHRELYPNAVDWLYITNETRLRELEKAGKDLTTERAVEHTVSFETGEAAQVFSDAIERLGGEVVAEAHNGLRFVRKHALDLASLNAVTVTLTLYAQEFDGRYLGWDLPAEA